MIHHWYLRQINDNKESLQNFTEGLAMANHNTHNVFSSYILQRLSAFKDAQKLV
jgi:hypothetical protein